MVTCRHSIKWKLAVNFELVGRGRPSTGVHQGITELRERNPHTAYIVDTVCFLESCGKKNSSYQEEHSLLETFS